MQECTLAYEALKEFEQDRANIIHHQHLSDGRVKVRSVYTGNRDRDIHAAMDADRRVAERLGATDFHRARIGRNVSCPCGSGMKFKKCCIGKSAHV